MFEGYSAKTGAGKFPLVLMVGRAEGLACVDPGDRTPIGARGNFFLSSSYLLSPLSSLLLRGRCRVLKFLMPPPPKY